MESLGYEMIFTNEYADGFLNEKAKTVACVMKADYIPIQKFKQLFEMMGDEVRENGKIEKFLFDKSSLRTFHQPSMKWYFTEWKTEMLKHGLKKHFKILPDLDYFKKSVEAARKPLLAKYPKDVLDQLRIEYYDSVEEAHKAQ
jgi:hypothetical protein